MNNGQAFNAAGAYRENMLRYREQFKNSDPGEVASAGLLITIGQLSNVVKAQADRIARLEERLGVLAKRESDEDRMIRDWTGDIEKRLDRLVEILRGLIEDRLGEKACRMGDSSPINPEVVGNTVTHPTSFRKENQ